MSFRHSTLYCKNKRDQSKEPFWQASLGTVFMPVLVGLAVQPADSLLTGSSGRERRPQARLQPRRRIVILIPDAALRWQTLRIPPRAGRPRPAPLAAADSGCAHLAEYNPFRPQKDWGRFNGPLQGTLRSVWMGGWRGTGDQPPQVRTWTERNRNGLYKTRFGKDRAGVRTTR